MPLIDDWSDEDEDDASMSGGGGGGSPGAGAARSNDAPSKQREPEFVPWSRYVSANADVSQREAGKLASGVEAQAKGVRSELNAASDKAAKDIGSNYSQPAAKPAPAFGQLQSGFGIGKKGQLSTQPPPPPKPAKASTAQAEQRQSASELRGATLPNAGMSARTVDPDKLKTDISNGAWKTAGDNLAGSKDLKSQMGEGWESFMARALNADQSANQLGSESGVQALLQRNGPASAFDAALVSGAGGDQFREFAKQFGHGALAKDIGGTDVELGKQWQQLMGDVDAASAARDKEIADAQRPMFEESPVGPVETEAPTGYGYKPGGFESYADFRNKLAVGGGLHDFGMDASPADAALNELGKAGLYNGQTAAGQFRQGVIGGAGDGIAGSLDDQNRHNAFTAIEAKYGPAAAAWLWDWMTEGIWNGMSGQNSGAMYKTLADLVEDGLRTGALAKGANGQVAAPQTAAQKAAEAAKIAAENDRKAAARGEVHSGSPTVTGPDGTKHPLNQEQAWYRGQAETYGWVDEWDRQFLAGNPTPVNPNAHYVSDF